MEVSLVALAYFFSMAAAIFLLWRFSHIGWYWHALAFAAALTIGFMPPLSGGATAIYDIAIGSSFIFLLVWGVGEPLFRLFHIHRHA